MNVESLTPAELRVAAQQRLMPVGVGVDRHWSITARIVQRVDAEQLYAEYGFTSTIQWAEDELGLDSYEVTRLLQLAQMISAASHVLPEQWRKLSASKAREVMQMVNLGGSPTHWVSAALQAKTTDQLRVATAKAMGKAEKDVFVRYGFRAPAASLPLYDAAMVLALPVATGSPNTPKERIHHPDVAFRCWDVIVAGYVLGEQAKDAALTAAPEEG